MVCQVWNLWIYCCYSVNESITLIADIASDWKAYNRNLLKVHILWSIHLGRSDPHTRTLFSYRKYKFCLIISGAYNFRSQSHINKSDNRSEQNTHEFLRNLIWECVRRLHLQKSIQMHFDWTCIAVCKLIVSIVSCYVIYTSHILLIQLYRLQRDTVYVFTNALKVIYLEFKLHCFFSHYY